MKIIATIIAFALALVTAFPTSLCGDDIQLKDTVELKSGSQLTGRILTNQKENGRDYLIFETSSGGKLKLDVRKLVKRINKIVPEYNELLDTMDPKSPDHHWQMYEWCKNYEKGNSRFKREMEFHLLRILELDPTDNQAMKRLGVERYDGQLMKREHKYSGHGYVRVTGGWIPELHLQIMEANSSAKAQMSHKRNEMKLWKRQLGKASIPVLQKALDNIANPSLVGEIYEMAMQETDPEMRGVYINSLGTVASSPAQNALIYFSIADEDPVNRDLATSLLLQPHYNRSTSAAVTAGFLKSNNNYHVNRAALLLRELDQLHVVNQLADAIVTTHEIATGNDPNRTTAGQQSGGNSSGGTFRMGSGGPAVVERVFENKEVLNALRAITKQSFGPDPYTWKAWYTNQHTIERIDLRSDYDR